MRIFNGFCIKVNSIFAAMQDLPFINFQGYVLLEPMNFVTDALIGLACAVYVFKMWQDNPKDLDSKLYRTFFIMVGLSSFFGGLTHLFAHYLDGISLRVLTWSLLGVGVFTFELATVRKNFKKKVRQILFPVFVFQLIAYFVALYNYMNFNVVIVNMLLGLFAFIVPIEMSTFFKSKNRGAFFIALGITLTLGSAAIHILQLSPHKWFDHKDLAHVVTVFTLLVIYKGTFERAGKTVPAKNKS